jgi:hypothetical protein
MTQTTRDLVLGLAFLFAFPLAMTVTGWLATR